MSLVEKWNDMARKNHELVDAHGTGEKTSVAQAMGAAYLGCLTDLRDACTPRKPQAGWFGDPTDADGNPTGKWDVWWFELPDGYGFLARGARNLLRFNSSPCIVSDTIITGAYFADTSKVTCIPVAREGFPAPVGWHVVGG